MEGNASNLAELIPHHNHSSLDGLSPVDVLRPSNDRCDLVPVLGEYFVSSALQWPVCSTCLTMSARRSF